MAKSAVLAYARDSRADMEHSMHKDSQHSEEFETASHEHGEAAAEREAGYNVHAFDEAVRQHLVAKYGKR